MGKARIFDHLLALLVVAVWGVTFVCTKTLIAAGMDPAAIFAVRFSPAILGQPVVFGNLLFLGLIASLACFILWNLAMARLGNVTSTNYVYLNPIFTLITAMILLGERLTPQSALGCAAILAGVIWAGRRQPGKV